MNVVQSIRLLPLRRVVFSSRKGLSTDSKTLHSIDFSPWQDLDSWLGEQPVDKWKDAFERDGYLEIPSLFDSDVVSQYQSAYSKFLSGEISCVKHRHDLGAIISGFLYLLTMILQVRT